VVRTGYVARLRLPTSVQAMCAAVGAGLHP
jgi:hypothetical protein